ncbi:cell envelope integrity protein TolA [Shewanella sedimentimangrovi]|uniref:Cell envelope integrity protein TolA n=1 Tax=Shewanella sedimentimangrovi TaxID=2814293 RepID=A0ABX7QWH5_9GAMM|nr:cell envelope integrity protein TolA [Shewanella sedimentimangrovi]QSX35784.1 cell envelope integrity protein TolA [Shewanella sedimentimangrovi]
MAVNSDFKLPLIISAAIHGGVILILALGIDFQHTPPPMPAASAPAVQAVVIDSGKVAARVEELKQQKRDEERRERARQEELERKADEAKRARELEQERIRKLEAERKQKEIETQKAADAAKAAKLKEQQEKEKAQKAEAERKQKEKERLAEEQAAKKAADKRKAEEEAARKAEEERKRKEAERKAKEEAERKRKAEEDAKRKAAEEAKRREQELADMMASEQDTINAAKNQQVMSELSRYQAMIASTLQRNVQKEDSMRGKSCEMVVKLAKDGFVISSRVKQGDAQVCRATQAAIQKLQRLPVSPQPEVYEKMKELNIIYKPEFN